MAKTSHGKQQRISDVARRLGLDGDDILPHGHHIAKIPIAELQAREKQGDGKLILVTAMTPTPQGEGKTTTSIGLADAMNHLGHLTSLCLREPSLGPYFGIKGGGTGAVGQAASNSLATASCLISPWCTLTPCARCESSAIAASKPLLAKAITYGSVTLFSATVDVRGTAPGIFVTQ